MTYKEIKKNAEVRELLRKGDENLGMLGYTDHSTAHCCLVAETAGWILEKLHFSDHEIELAKIAGYMHDIGNIVNRIDHAQSGAVMAIMMNPLVLLLMPFQQQSFWQTRQMCEKTA